MVTRMSKASISWSHTLHEVVSLYESPWLVFPGCRYMYVHTFERVFCFEIASSANTPSCAGRFLDGAAQRRHSAQSSCRPSNPRFSTLARLELLPATTRAAYCNRGFPGPGRLEFLALGI